MKWPPWPPDGEGQSCLGSEFETPGDPGVSRRLSEIGEIAFRVRTHDARAESKG